jgi:hypothetical protein
MASPETFCAVWASVLPAGAKPCLALDRRDGSVRPRGHAGGAGVRVLSRRAAARGAHAAAMLQAGVSANWVAMARASGGRWRRRRRPLRWSTFRVHQSKSPEPGHRKTGLGLTSVLRRGGRHAVNRHQIGRSYT